MPTMPRQPTLPLFASLWIFLAVFLLPMDKAIALRNLVLLLGLGLCLWQWRSRPSSVLAYLWGNQDKEGF